MNKRISGALRRIFFALAAVYLLACAVLYLTQAHFIFFPEKEIASTPANFGCTFENVIIPEQSNKLHGWWLSGRNGKTVLYLHGNGGNIGANAEHACRFQKIGFSTLLFDYRGYGESDGGFPSEKSVYQDADRAWSYLAEKYTAPSDVIIYGHSMGGAVAIELARRHPDARGLIIESSFTSLADMAAHDRMFRVFPLRLLLTQRMDSISKVSSLKMPILFIHGTADQLVPSFMTEQLFDQARGPKSLFLVSGAGHENCAATAGKRYGEVVLKFVGTSEVSQTSGAAVR